MGLDENLPSFHLSDNNKSSKNETNYLLTRGGEAPEPAYTLKRPDPSSPTAQNCYAAALFDAYSPEILFGEVLIRPKWTQPSLSQEDIRRNGGVPPPPEPILPTEFTIQLYNPDLQIEVHREQSTFGTTHYDFSMPQDTFRMPSGSMLDKSQHDPAASHTTPKINFSFKRESKFGKDMIVYLKGKSTDVVQKKKSKEPDISIALFKSLREVTIYEPNLHRVEMEDPKGLEVVILLVATVIKDVYYGQLRQVFNVNEASRRRTSSSAGKENNVLRKEPTGTALGKQPTAMMSGGLPAASGSGAGAAVGGLYDTQQSPPPPGAQAPNRRARQSDPGPPITDPRTQWELDAETARLKAAADAEAKEARRQEDARRREQARRDEQESRRLMKQLEAEEKERRRKEREIEKETERLRKIYGDQSQQVPGLSPPPRTGPAGSQSAPVVQGPFPGPSSRPPPPQQAPGPSQRPQGIPVQQRPGYVQYTAPANVQQRPQQPTGYRPPGPPRQQAPQPIPGPPNVQYAPPPQQPQPQPQVYNNGLFPTSSGAFQAGQSVTNLLKPGKQKQSMWNLRSRSEDQGRLTKKTSSVW